MRKIVLTFGLIAGAVLAGMMFLTIPFMEQIGMDRGAIIGYTTMVLAFLMVYFGVRSYRDDHLGGRIGFGTALGVGLMITLVASLCYVAAWEYLYFNHLSDFADKYAAYAIEAKRAAGATAEELAALTKSMEDFQVKYKDPLYNAAVTLLEPLPVGLLYTLISAIVLGPVANRRRAA